MRTLGLGLGLASALALAMAAAPGAAMAGTAAGGGFGFGPVQAIAPAAVRPKSFGIGDMDGDGLDDVVVLSNGLHPQLRRKVLLYLQRQEGGFAPPRSLSYATDGDTIQEGAMRLSDVDTDGDLDIVVATSIPNRLVVLRNDGDAFPVASDIGTRTVRSLTVVDIDRDGHPDVVLTPTLGDVVVHRGDGHGGFAAATPFVFGSGGGYSFADMTGDGHADLLYSLQGQLLMHASEDTGFSATPTLLLRFPDTADRRDTAIALADFDRDGRRDVAMRVGSTGNQDTRALLIALQGPDGRFARRRFLGTDHGLGTLRAADLDADGIIDLVAGVDGDTGVYLGRDGGFAPRVDFAVPAWSGGQGLGDINGDGLLDLVFVDDGIAAAPGILAPREADYALAAGLAPDRLTLTVSNAGTDEPTGPAVLRATLEGRLGAIEASTEPRGCSVVELSGRLGLRCNLDALRVGASVQVVAPFVAATRPDQLVLHAWIEPALFPDLRGDNNHATARIRLDAPARAVRRPDSGR